jgi:hypothetical protein
LNVHLVKEEIWVVKPSIEQSGTEVPETTIIVWANLFKRQQQEMDDILEYINRRNPSYLDTL